MGLIQQIVAHESELERENARLRRLLDEAGLNAERAARLLAEADEEHQNIQQSFIAVAERQSFHMAELGHRLRNTISLVQAIAHQSLRNATSLDAARDALDLRLGALWRVHEALLADDWSSASVAAVVQGITSLHGDGEPERFVLRGDPDVQLDAQAALSLGLALHELATNAAKYGSLSNREGFVQVRWRVRAKGPLSAMVLRWSEHGGPLVQGKPSRIGFGSRLIDRCVAGIGGEANFIFGRMGVVCSLSLPLPPPASE